MGAETSKTEKNLLLLILFHGKKGKKGCLQVSNKWLRTIKSREYLMGYRELSFLVVTWFGSSPSPFPPISKLSVILSLPVCRRRAYWQERGRGGGRGAKSYDLEKVWPSISHSILSGQESPNLHQSERSAQYIRGRYFARINVFHSVCSVSYCS